MTPLMIFLVMETVKHPTKSMKMMNLFAMIIVPDTLLNQTLKGIAVLLTLQHLVKVLEIQVAKNVLSPKFLIIIYLSKI